MQNLRSEYDHHLRTDSYKWGTAHVPYTMATNDEPQSDSTRTKVDAHTVEEGDEVFMGVNFHMLADDVDGAEYDREIHQAGVSGTIVDAPRDGVRELMADGESVMADFRIEAENGEKFTWHIDNGYVLGHHPGLDRRSGVGKFGGFYK